jgi:hypothetical protein
MSIIRRFVLAKEKTEFEVLSGFGPFNRPCCALDESDLKCVISGVICDVTKRFLMDLKAVLGLFLAVLVSFL